MPAPGDDVTNRALATLDAELEWQDELDTAMADIDQRLRHPRRRASDAGKQPTLPELGQVDLTSELLDEISWRVAEQIRRSQVTAAAAAAPVETPFRPAAVPSPSSSGMPCGAALVIRLRSPLFRWPRWLRSRRKRHALTTVKLSA